MPRFYRFDGSTGMDLRPAAVLEADAARIDELRRRRDSMAVATRIRMVDQPPEGLLPLSLFDRTPLPDRTALHPRTMETVAPDIAGLYVDYMTRIAMGAPKRVAFRIPLLGAVWSAGTSMRNRCCPEWWISLFLRLALRACCLISTRPHDVDRSIGDRGGWFRMRRRISI